ncbi:MAG: threonine-phosphate decarboxylase CobD [Candidatus Manganitrophaceae bacterium]
MNRDHGGNLAEISERYGFAPEEILDFSASINPLGPPKRAWEAFQASFQEIGAYPDPECRALRRKLAASLSRSPRQILIGNGSTELIFLIPRVLAPRSVLIFTPTYQDYEEAARSAHCSIQYADLDPTPTVEGLGAMLSRAPSTGPAGADLVFICNPNNPTGNALSGTALARLIRRHPKSLFVIDEAYADLAEEERFSLLTAPLPENAIVLRSFTKVYRIPGLRLGFAVASEQIIDRLEQFKEPWSVSGPALKVGEALLEETAFVAESRCYLRREREPLFEGLKGVAGLSPIRSETNFILVRLTGQRSAEDLKAALIQKKILIRSCHRFRGLGPDFFRVAVRKEEENRRLTQALKEVLQ